MELGWLQTKNISLSQSFWPIAKILAYTCVDVAFNFMKCYFYVNLQCFCAACYCCGFIKLQFRIFYGHCQKCHVTRIYSRAPFQTLSCCLCHLHDPWFSTHIFCPPNQSFLDLWCRISLFPLHSKHFPFYPK